MSFSRDHGIAEAKGLDIIECKRAEVAAIQIHDIPFCPWCQEGGSWTLNRHFHGGKLHRCARCARLYVHYRPGQEPKEGDQS